MAVTITQNPQLYTPSDNPVRWTFNSTQYAQTNFQFLIEVYVNSVLRSRHVVFPEVNSDTAHFDAEAEKISNVICSPPTTSISTFSTDAANHALIHIKVIEQYGDPIASQASATSTAINVFKASLSDTDFVAWDYLDYSLGGATNKFLTFFPRTNNMLCSQDNENLFIMALSKAGVDVIISTYTSSGTLVATDTVAITSAKIGIINLSPKSIIANTTITYANFTASAYYTFYIYDGVTASETLRVDLDVSCDDYGTKRLHFLSSIGSIEAFSFTKANEQSREITSFGMEKQWGGWNSSNEFNYDNTQGREIDYLKTSAGKLSISTDWLSEDVQNWLARELYESPYIFMEIEDGTLLKRVKCTNTNSITKKNSSGILFQEICQLNTSDARKSAVI